MDSSLAVGCTSSTDPGTHGMQDDEGFRREADELVRLYGELGRRLSNRGIRGVDELISMHEQVLSAVDTIAQQEIDAALLHIATLLDRLRLLGRCLVTLGEMKAVLGHSTASGTSSPDVV